MAKKERTYANFGEYLYWSYANIQMLHYALNNGVQRYNRMCYMIRAKAFKAYKEGLWNIHDLFEFNITKIKQNDYCWYCGKEMEPTKQTKGHVFPRSKGGVNEMDNIIMVCKTCNSSKGNMDLFEWYSEVRQEWPPFNVMVHYLKNIYLYSVENALLESIPQSWMQWTYLSNGSTFRLISHSQKIIGLRSLKQMTITDKIQNGNI